MLNRVITLMQFFKRESCFDTSRDYHCFLLFAFFLQQFVGCLIDFLKMIMSKIWIQNRVLNLSGHISISRKLWIHQTGWIVFPLTYRTWAKSLFHFLMDTRLLFEMNQTEVLSIFHQGKVETNILLSYLHITQLCALWNHQRILKKIVYLKIWQLVSFWGV
jgi:hypothetical protein